MQPNPSKITVYQGGEDVYADNLIALSKNTSLYQKYKTALKKYNKCLDELEKMMSNHWSL